MRTSLTDFLEQHMLPCNIKALTGLSCPGCGTQRAIIALLKGDVTGSLLINPGVLFFLITILYCLLHIRLRFTNGARNVTVLFIFTVSLMIVNFVVNLSSAM